MPLAGHVTSIFRKGTCNMNTATETRCGLANNQDWPRSNLTRDEAAAYLGIKPQTLAVWASTGRYGLPFVKVGRSVRYKLVDLDAFQAANTHSQTQ
jgi:excisionase family DNA binding protein